LALPSFSTREQLIMSTLALTEQFIEHGKYLRGWSVKTIRTYRQSLATLHAAEVGSLTRSSLQQFVVWMRARGLSAGGINIRIRSVNSFLSWLHDEGHAGERLRIRLLPKSASVLVTFSDAEIRRVVGLRPVGRAMTRAWTLFVVMLDTGLRIDEALGLERERVDLDALTLTVRGKGDRHRVVPISVQGRKALFRLIAGDGSRFVFTTDTGQRMSYRNAYRDLKKLCRRAGVQGSHVRPHCIRHYFAVSFIRAGGDLYRLSRMLGHTSIATTQLYLRSMGLEHLQEGHAKYSPLGRLA
jgi:site-specific recombinase XerD